MAVVKVTARYLLSMPASFLAGMLVCAAAQADDEFLAMPGLWKTTYELEGAGAEPRGPKVVWHCVDEEADPWIAFAQLQDLPGMTCSRSSLQRNSTSLKWQNQCRGPGPETVADIIEVSGAISFDSPQHYTGWVKFSGILLGYPVSSASKVDGIRKAACTSPSD